MKDINAEYMPRAESEKARTDDDLRARVEQVLNDWDDPNWLQFSMWHLHQIQAYLYRVLKEEN